MGAWIEIVESECYVNYALVAPIVGAWIEIVVFFENVYYTDVAPIVGAWIEIDTYDFYTRLIPLSLLSWERGLK